MKVTTKEVPLPPSTKLVIVGAPGSALGVDEIEFEVDPGPAAFTARMTTG